MDARPASSWVRSPWFLTSAPQTSEGIIDRPRLFSQLDAAVGSAHLAVIAAPSGYGKTMLVSSWARHRDAPTAWLTLTRHERDDEELLLMGLLSAVDQLVGARTGADAPAQAPAGPRDLIGRIAASVRAWGEPLVLVIDDAHHAGRVLGDGTIDLLIRLTDGNLRFVLAGSPELLPLFPKILIAHPSIAMTADDLAMTVEEIVQDAARRGQDIDATTATAYRAATGGWPIALHLQLLAASGALTASLGDESLLVEYIDAAVLPTLSPRLRGFVLAASTCSRLDPALAEALTGETESRELLDECVDAGLFLNRFDDGAGHSVYRWHDAFADACRTILRRGHGTRARMLHEIAARALVRDFPAEALWHALNAENPDLVVELIRSCWMRMLVELGARALHNTCIALPAPLVDDPEMVIIRACCLNLLDERANARALAAGAIARAGDDSDFLITLPFAQLFLLDDGTELEAAVDAAEQVIDSGAGDPSMHAYRVFLVGWTRLRLRRRPEQAVVLLQAAVDEARATRRPVLLRRAGSNLLFALAYGGRFVAADRLRENAMLSADADDEWYRYDGGIGLFATGFSAYWRGDLAEAERDFRVLVDVEGQDDSYTALARAFLAFIAALRGRPGEVRAARALLSGISREERHGVPWVAYRLIAQAELLSASGRIEESLDLIEGLRRRRSIPGVHVIAAEIARRAGRHELAMDFLRALSDVERGISYIAAAAETTAALVAFAENDHERAQVRLGRALDAASREDIRLPFLREDADLRVLLSQHALAGSPHATFIAARLADLDGVADSELGIPLSAREREVYGYLGTSMTAGEIAAALFVSVNTVRTHQRAIYRKLGVANRRDAVRLRLQPTVQERGSGT